MGTKINIFRDYREQREGRIISRDKIPYAGG